MSYLYIYVDGLNNLSVDDLSDAWNFRPCGNCIHIFGDESSYRLLSLLPPRVSSPRLFLRQRRGGGGEGGEGCACTHVMRGRSLMAVDPPASLQYRGAEHVELSPCQADVACTKREA